MVFGGDILDNSGFLHPCLELPSCGSHTSIVGGGHGVMAPFLGVHDLGEVWTLGLGGGRSKTTARQSHGPVRVSCDSCHKNA